METTKGDRRPKKGIFDEMSTRSIMDYGRLGNVAREQIEEYHTKMSRKSGDAERSFRPSTNVDLLIPWDNYWILVKRVS